MILWIIYIIADASVNWYWIVKRKTVPNYILLTIVRGLFLILIGISIPILTYLHLALWVPYCVTSFWLFFDPLLNTLRGNKWNYIGGNSTIDKFGRKNPKSYWRLKVASCILFIISTAILCWFKY